MPWVMESVKHLVVSLRETPPPREILCDKEAALYAALKTQKRRRDWLAARWAAKRLIADALLTKDLRRIEILNDDDGRPWPYCPGSLAADWTLSLTHSGELAGAAIDPSGRPLGLDLEKVEPRDPAFIPVAFSEIELAGGRDDDALTRLWTIKEAVLKFLGLGLSVDLHDVLALPVLELRGKAAEKHAAMGGPKIVLTSRKEDGHWLTLAFQGD